MNTALFHIDTGDTAWMLMCVVLMLLMTLGVGFFQSGLSARTHLSDDVSRLFYDDHSGVAPMDFHRIHAGLRSGCSWKYRESLLDGVARCAESFLIGIIRPLCSTRLGDVSRHGGDFCFHAHLGRVH